MDIDVRKGKDRERGKETLFRVTNQHQSKLIQIADYKANIIITISTTIISAIIAITGYTAAAGKLDIFGIKLIIPVIMIILTCLMALVLAIQAARPKLIQIKPNENSNRKTSILFFGVIAAYSQHEYLEKMKNLLDSSDDMYEQMTIDLHNQGVILKRKYNLLVYAYLILMYGFVLSVLTYVCLLLFGVK